MTIKRLIFLAFLVEFLLVLGFIYAMQPRTAPTPAYIVCHTHAGDVLVPNTGGNPCADVHF